MPRSADPGLIVGFETSDDAGVFVLPGGQALVQTIDFFTPVVDDPSDYGRIAATNSLSDVYAMGGRPLTAMNVCCFDPDLAPPDVWAAVVQGMHEKTVEAGAVLVGGHTVKDSEPKFGMSVTGLVDPERALRNDQARPGDDVWLSKPLGTGIVTTAAKNDACPPEILAEAVRHMTTLNAAARDAALAAGARCATDVTGFGLIGHLSNIARASRVAVEIEASALPLLPEVARLAAEGWTTAGGDANRRFVGERLAFSADVPAWVPDVICDPQTSGGLAVCSRGPVEGSVRIGRIVAGDPGIAVR